ncbi:MULTISPECIES: DUF2004 domain-containing protein [Arthrobacter]|uniref:DUF2004 domain-containing protein n=1 Tax=Arthrobacter oryzae TaxID=409290 RepID=A0A3N0BX40_9MICC|nr:MULTISPECIES: DUF2004 domain-containing protein [Arthrobacter]QYF90019.1 DUF2004 domain-containing protein [Arthrobacter sp. PAMC25284]RNL53881.1 DUF2004 domain-containing protein [Arthrobacter oryzae]
MSKVASQHFGQIELNHGRDHNFSAKHELAGQLLELDLNVDAHDHFDEAALHKVDYRLRFLPELVDQVREMIADELDEEGTSPQEYRHFHCNAIKPEQLQKVFGVTDTSQLTNEVFLKALKLGHVGIFPGQPERYFVLDFTLGSHFTDEVLVASADEDGVVDDEILWES